METIPLLHRKVLQILAGRYGSSCTIEELVNLLSPVLNDSTTLTNKVFIEKENQSRLLEALILLNDDGYIFLNPYTDKSSITIKGLMKINNNVVRN